MDGYCKAAIGLGLKFISREVREVATSQTSQRRSTVIRLASTLGERDILEWGDDNILTSDNILKTDKRSTELREEGGAQLPKQFLNNDGYFPKRW
jgi:hypothetical protein